MRPGHVLTLIARKLGNHRQKVDGIKSCSDNEFTHTRGELLALIPCQAIAQPIQETFLPAEKPTGVVELTPALMLASVHLGLEPVFLHAKLGSWPAIILCQVDCLH